MLEYDTLTHTHTHTLCRLGIITCLHAFFSFIVEKSKTFLLFFYVFVYHEEFKKLFKLLASKFYSNESSNKCTK